VVGHANCRARMSQDQFVPSLEWSVRSSPRSAWPVLRFNAAVNIDLGSQTLQLIPQEPAHGWRCCGVVALSEGPGDGRFDDERKLSGHRRIVLRILAWNDSGD
jgi:hypothetical protein